MAKGKRVNEAKLVLVTGPCSLVGSHIVVNLLDCGFHVRGAVRNLKEKTELNCFEFLEDYAHSDRFQPFELDLCDPQERFDKSCEGCVAVIHVATVTKLRSPNPEEEIVRPAVESNQKLIRAAAKANVDTYVFTSSMYAVTERFVPGKVYSERDWNEECSVDREAYSYAKTKAERAGYETVAELTNLGMRPPRLVSFCVGMVIGPILTMNGRKETSSLELFREMLKGGLPVMPRFTFTVVDVRDVARAHVAAIEDSSASGRYLAGSPFGVRIQDMADVLRERFPRSEGYSIPSWTVPNFVAVNLFPLVNHDVTRALFENNVDASISLDASRIQDLMGGELRDWRQSVVDSGVSLVQEGAIPKKSLASEHKVKFLPRRSGDSFLPMRESSYSTRKGVFDVNWPLFASLGVMVGAISVLLFYAAPK